MKRLPRIFLSIAVGLVLGVLILGTRPVAIADAAEACVAKNGDVNADGRVDLSDPITTLGYLFLGNPTSLAPLCAPTEASSSPPATGQTTCSNFVDGLWVEVPCGEAACPGQDGSYATGCPIDGTDGSGRFLDNDDGTVTDTCTGLMWQKDTADVDEIFADTLAWCEALEYCEDLSFADYEDWRLPNVRELQSIVDYGTFNPAIDPIFGALSEFYWTSTTYADAPDDAWGVGFNVGYVGIRVKTGDFDFSFNYIRAVRSAR